MQYRKVKSSFEESMENVQIVNTIQELREKISKELEGKFINFSDIKFEYAGFDRRNEWATYVVLIDYNKSEDWMPVGMSDGNTFLHENVFP